MIFEDSLLNYIINLVIILSYKILLLISLLFMLYLLRKMYNIKNKEYSYKIYDFDFNGFCIFI